MRVENLTPVLNAAPGERATMRLRVENTEAGPLTYRLRVIGFDDAYVLCPPPNGPLPPGASEDVDLQFVIPEAFAAGHHSVAVEVVPDGAGAASAIAGVTVAVGSIDAVAIAVVPSTIRGHRRASFRLDIDNRAGEPIDLTLDGEGPDVLVSLRPDRVRLRPGDRIRTSGKVRGPRHWVGEPVPRPMTITARGRSAPSYAPATFIQRPLLPRGLRAALLILLVVALWAGALGLGLLWWNQREQADETPRPAALVDTDGDGIADTPGDQLVDTDGDGVGDTPAAIVAAEVERAADEASAEQNAGGPELPTRTTIGGKVRAGETGNDAGVAVTLTPLELGAAPSPVAALASPAGEARVAKLWPARAGTFGADGEARQTVSVESTASGDDGAFLFDRIPIRQTYEVHFALAGFDSQAFVVTPPEDGSPVELDVQLQPATGEVSGIVVGPAGPLGNVDVTVSDGTLTFGTTTSTDAGEEGTWRLTGISTPGAYTLTATLRGYGTEVLQLSFDPGEVLTGIRITMVPGVGSIGGRITTASPTGRINLGGVTLTASSGELSTTTTSLTEGDRGRYLFPKLDVPGRYTITAAADGYLTQTRVVTLSGNVTGVDFDMVATTATIEGRVVSDRFGPLVGANIRITRDDLVFDTPSASTPPGSFEIEDLPPGTYLVEFSRFDHRPASQIVTLAAGDVVNLGRILLEFTDRPDIEQDGSLEVRVVDSRSVDLVGATVTVRDVGTGRVAARLTDEDPPDQASFVFAPLPIGTYNVTVSKRLYRDSTRRVSVGLERERLIIPLFELGQASGRMVDSLTGAELDEYTVSIHLVRPDGSLRLIETINVPKDAPADKGPDRNQVRWETSPNKLNSGLYEVQVDDPPPGYRVVPDQILQPGEAPMRFRVRPTSDDPLDLADIEADIFPELTGMVLAPQFAAATNTVSFDPIDRDDLAVTLNCDSDPDGLAAPVLEDVAGGPEPDSFRFGPVDLEEANLFGRCRLTASASGFLTATIPIPTPLDPTDGTRDPDRVVNIALVREEDVAGHAFWLDRGFSPPVERDAGGVNVRTQGRVIIGFAAGEGDGSQPRIIEPATGLTATANAGGLWAFGNPKQVFGRTTYVLSGTHYQPRLIAVTIDQDDRTVAPADSSGRRLRVDAGGLIQVELDANGGPIVGTVNVRTIKGTAQFPGTVAAIPDFVLSLTGPETRAANAVQTAVGTDRITGQARIDTTDPGTYLATITAPDHHEVLAGTPPPVDLSRLQLPGQTVDDIVGDFVELGRLDVDAVNTSGAAIAGATVRIDSVPSAGGDPPATTRTDVVGPSGRVTFLDLPVNSVNPTTAGVRWDAAVTAAGFDLDAARVEIVTETSTCTSGCGPARAFVRAGGQQRIRFVVPRFGTIDGAVLGENDASGARTPLPIGGPSPLTVTATRVADATGNRLATPDAPITGVADPTAADGFRISGRPGWYTIAVTNPEYEATPIQVPNPNGLLRGDVVVGPILPLPGDVPVFRMINDVDNDLAPPYVLRVERGAIDLTVHQDTRGGAGLADASVTLTGPGDDPTAIVDNVPTPADGRLLIERLVPGTYRLTVRKTVPVDPGDPTGPREDAYFPVIVRVQVPIGTTVAARTVEVDVPLPQIGGAITGTVGARNLDGDPVPLPASVEITRDYTAPQIDTEGTLIDNQATEGDINRGARPTPSVTVTPAGDPGTPQPFRFENLASGLHELTFSEETGYTAPTGVSETVLGIATSAIGRLDYVAANRTVVVNVTLPGGAAATGATVRLTHPDGTDDGGVEGPAGTFTFVEPPELQPYTIVVTKDLHEPLPPPDPLTVPPGDPATPVTATVVVAPTEARIVGVAQKLTGPGRQEPFNDEGTVSLIQATSGNVVDSKTPDASGNYEFLVAEPGQYRLRLELDGFATRESAAFGVTLGVETSAPEVVVPALATFEIEVEPPPAPGAITVAVSSPPSQAGVVPTIDANVWTFRVDPDFAYQFRVSSPQFLTQVVTPTPSDPAPGQVVPRETVTLAPRTISGTVRAGSPAAGVAGASVAATKGSVTRTDTTSGGTSAGAYTVSRIDAGTWGLVAEKLGTGRGTGSVTVPADSPNITGANLTLTARDVDVTFTLRDPGGTNIAGTVQLLDADGDVVASGSGTGPVTVTAPETAFPLDWRATSSGRIPDTGDADISLLTNTLNQTTLTLPIGIVELARPTITGRVLAPGGGGANNADVFMCLGATGACTASTSGVITDRTGTGGGYSVVPTAAGTWRLRAERGAAATDGFVTVVVGAEGQLTPAPPINLQLVAPPSPN